MCSQNNIFRTAIRWSHVLPVAAAASTFCFLLFLLPLPVEVVGAGGTATGAAPSCSLCSASTGSTFFTTTGDWSGFTSAGGGSSAAHHGRKHNYAPAGTNHTLPIMKTSDAERSAAISTRIPKPSAGLSSTEDRVYRVREILLNHAKIVEINKVSTCISLCKWGGGGCR